MGEKCKFENDYPMSKVLLQASVKKKEKTHKPHPKP